ncbi:hypothetical protein Glove_104g50 [Diversispora epigaea]|uniref:N-acetyltransferase domain-containing protein n=1 Tax=Diversispora epigaea TaxID=1348612 RepID=A0A397J343_9GLOM|nr:hypothetical protein Glove_104g50 [Diversispora epigaea]
MGVPTKEPTIETKAVEDTKSIGNTNSPKTKKKRLTTTHRISLGDVTPNNLGQLKRLNSVLFPVNYSEKFYKDVLEVGEFAKLAYFNDACVGAVCCRKEPIQGTIPEQTKLYIMTLGVLAPYRNLGLGTTLLTHILHHATCGTPTAPKFIEIFLHVQTSNEEALAFYQKYGFEIIGTVEGYYKKITPPDAYILSKKLVKNI